MAQKDTSSDLEFIEYLYESYYKILRINIYKMTNDHSIVGDLINEVFIKLMNKIDLLRSLECHKRTSYIVYTVKSVCIDYLRKQNRQSQHSFLGLEEDLAQIFVDTTGPSTEEICAAQEEIKELGLILYQLSERDRELLVYKYVCEFSNKEIADILKTSPANIRQYTLRARARARKIFEQERVDNL